MDTLRTTSFGSNTASIGNKATSGCFFLCFDSPDHEEPTIEGVIISLVGTSYACCLASTHQVPPQVGPIITCPALRL